MRIDPVVKAGRKPGLLRRSKEGHSIGLRNSPGAAAVGAIREPDLAGPVGFSVARLASSSRASTLLVDQTSTVRDASDATSGLERQDPRRTAEPRHAIKDVESMAPDALVANRDDNLVPTSVQRMCSSAAVCRWCMARCKARQLCTLLARHCVSWIAALRWAVGCLTSGIGLGAAFPKRSR